MPISQQRMMTLINAALDYQQAFDELQQAVHNAYRYATESFNSNGSREQIYQFIQDLDGQNHSLNLLTNAKEAKVAIALEHRHFKQFAKRNQSEAIRQSRRRGRLPSHSILSQLDQLDYPVASGAPGDNSPGTLYKANHLKGKSIYQLAQQATSLPVTSHQPPSLKEYPLLAQQNHLKKPSPEALAAEISKVKAEAAAEAAELQQFAAASQSASHQPDMLQDLTSAPVQQFAEEVFSNSPKLFDIPKPANSAELDLLVEKELARQRAIEAFEATNSPPATSQPAPVIDTEELE